MWVWQSWCLLLAGIFSGSVSNMYMGKQSNDPQDQLSIVALTKKYKARRKEGRKGHKYDGDG